VNLLSTSEAAEQKGVSRQAILDAVRRGALDGQQVGGFTAVKANKKFGAWEPIAVRQKAGRALAAKKAKKTKKARRKS
jgi:hypothetical protein